MVNILETPLSPSTFKSAIELLGLRVEQVAYDLNISEKSVMAWRKKSTPSPRATGYIQEWLNRVDNDITEIVNRSVADYENGTEYIVLVTAWSSEGMAQLEPRYKHYPARVHNAMIGRVFAELNARKIPCRVEQVERQNVTSRQREPLPNFILEQ